MKSFDLLRAMMDQSCSVSAPPRVEYRTHSWPQVLLLWTSPPLPLPAAAGTGKVTKIHIKNSSHLEILFHYIQILTKQKVCFVFLIWKVFSPLYQSLTSPISNIWKMRYLRQFREERCVCGGRGLGVVWAVNDIFIFSFIVMLVLQQRGRMKCRVFFAPS